MNTPALRAALATLAQHTPGIFYYASDIASEVPEGAQKQVRNALSLLGYGFLMNQTPGDIGTYTFTGLTKNDIDTGNWTVTVDYTENPVLDAPAIPEDAPDTTDATVLRPYISQKANETEKTFFLSDAMFADMPPKIIESAQELDHAGSGAMMVANAMSGYLEAHQAQDITFSMVLVDSMKAAQFAVKIAFNGFPEIEDAEETDETVS